MEKNKKKAVYIAALITGLLLGIFGVFLSIFTDGTMYERIITILIVLIIYGIAGIILGIWKPEKPLLSMPWLNLPGVIVLLFYMYREFNALYIIYMLLILTVSYFGLKTGKSSKRNRK